MKKDFSFYEFTGIFLPGATLLFGFVWLFPSHQTNLNGANTSLGTLGIFIIAAYLAGHLIQSIGNIMENIAWFITGKPTHWITREKTTYLSQDQQHKLPVMLHKLTGANCDDLKTLSKRCTGALQSQLYAKLKKDGRAERVDIFNGNYGMFRGIAAASFVIAITTLFVNGSIKPWANTYIALTVFFIAAYRCYRFGVHYASEIYRQSFNLHHELNNPKPNKK